jgi:hypothetical protein
MQGFSLFFAKNGLRHQARGSNQPASATKNHWHRFVALVTTPLRWTAGRLSSRICSNAITTSFMSQHRSLRAAASTGGKRNVLKRFERVAILKSRAQWKDGERVTGLRKTKPPE